jgi:phosphoglycolate phosphatase-like HAD superfamily hydrolase
MARCALCESDVPDGRADCDACGQPFDRPGTARATPEAVRKAVEGARKELLAATLDPADIAFPRGLLERAEQTEAAGDLGRALDLARACRRAMDIIKRENRLAEALAHAEAVLEDAKQAGIETVAFQRNIEQARAVAARGDLTNAERLLRRISVRTLDQRRERVLQGSLEKA